MKPWVQKHRLFIFFVLAFLWSWGWWSGLIFSTASDAVLSGNMPPSFIIFAIMGGFGPSIAGIATALLAGGRREAGALLSGIKKSRFGAGWYAASILTVPLLTLAQAGLQALTGRSVMFNVPGMMMVMGFVWPVFSSFGEEIGWRGYALPAMQKRFGILPASLLLGLVWGVWHLPSDYMAYSSYGWLFIPIFLLLGPVNLTAHSVIMTFIYNRTKGSVLAMILYHYTITMTGILTPSFSFNGMADDIAKTAVSVAVICAAAAAVAVFSKTMRGGLPESADAERSS